tara:strand:- start:377 stop:676 length:300 start_codon:yes stop_codon:yes gene_type:complete
LSENLNKVSMPSWEVFVQPKKASPFKHMGNLHASDEEMALQNARELYTRRQEGTCIWVVRTEHIISSQPEDSETFFDPSKDKIYRYPGFFKVSKKVDGL